MSCDSMWPAEWNSLYERSVVDHMLLPKKIISTLDGLTPEGKKALDSALFDGALSDPADDVGKQQKKQRVREPSAEKRQKKYQRSILKGITKKAIFSVINKVTFPAFNFLAEVQGSHQHTGQQPLSYVWTDNIPRSAASYYATINTYSTIAKPSMASATSTTANGQYIIRDGQTAGMLCLAKYWHSIGQSKEDPHPVPARDIVKSGHKFNEFVNYIQKTQLLSHSINRALQVIDPSLHAKLTHLREVVHQKFPAVKVFDDYDPLLFEGREIIFNRQSGPHVDKQDPQLGWVALVALGDFKGDVRLEPSDIIFLRGRVVKHQIKGWDEGQRIIVAHFTHTRLWKEVGLVDQVSI
ncbi:hypothetical protein PISMIDRAFT_25248 [Pisolithus microcarpus 441]|uniref:Unplaced genomic scaffold scaffold_195, whole genome shotgun sequence n=1 Tax=Pisolithus microcarpus 441 TaxID=765257 RepID=A0A0C9Z791_9AGAM|nr:hypothetical protein BKA83DRAFT_4133991 [Pisolithus microcarpus]KAI6025391.1 hypothetical protein BKA83DRAFT_25248 [Pisolithus microcarpus]KIK15753.1 hypothetical protein PISMIDRAFT_25248 [Pisolithus microcarpus 441]